MAEDILKTAFEWAKDFELEGIEENLYEAEGLKVIDTNKVMDTTLDLAFEELRETERAYVSAANETEIVDGYCDLAFVALNGIYKTFRYLGQTHEQAVENAEESLRRVCAANSSKKIDGQVTKNANGKVIKPEDFQPPTFWDLV